MTSEQGVGSGGFDPLQRREGIHVGQQVFVLTVRTAMDEQQPIAPQRHRQVGKKILVLLAQLIGRPLMGQMASPFRQLGGVAAVAGVEAFDDVLIPAALAGGDGALTY